eukprot:SAG11_NODE_21838_length_417_cov_1.955975_1_plen_66_part_01
MGAETARWGQRQHHGGKDSTTGAKTAPWGQRQHRGGVGEGCSHLALCLEKSKQACASQNQQGTFST